MIIFILNCGSSSIKYQLINTQNEYVMAKGLIERIGMDGAILKHSVHNAAAVEIKAEIPNHKVGIQMIIQALTDEANGVIKSMAEIEAVGHRIVHGGERFGDSVLITPDVIESIEDCYEIAPLHNPPNMEGVRACQEIMPNVWQVAVFDTAFHQTMPPEAYLYGLPYEEYENYGLRRYGFHGSSHKYVAHRAARLMEQDITDLRIITCHLGNGASLAAVKYGHSVDTSMGFTPLEGLIMGTRCGEIDPTVVQFLIKKKGITPEEMDVELNRRSGVLGISGISSDFRDLETAMKAGNERAELAINMFCYRVRKYIGAYAAAMGGVDAVVFTAGLGENSSLVRKKICQSLKFIGIKLDLVRNDVRGKEKEISAEDSPVKVFVIPTNEELVIARDTLRLCRRIRKKCGCSVVNEHCGHEDKENHDHKH